MAQRTAFVTGATGFLGLNLVEQLCAGGWRVTALHRHTSNLSGISRFPVDLVEGDLLEHDSLEQAIPREVDCVFHVAADTSTWSRHAARQTRINVEGTRNVIRAALANRARCFVHTSTWNVYGLEQGELHEDLPQTAGSSWINYNRSKFLAEEEVRQSIRQGLDAVIINPSHIMGRYDEQGWARLIIAAYRRRLPGAPPGAGTFCHAEQVARAHIAAAERGQIGRNYLLGGVDADFVEVFRTIGAITGRRLPGRVLPAWLFRLAARASLALSAVTGREPEITPEGAAIACARARVVSTRSQQELGYRPSPLRAMIEDCYAWLRAEGPLKSA